MCPYIIIKEYISYSVGELKATHLHHGLVSTQGQQHAGAQLVFSQREQELLGLVAGAHQDVNLQERTVALHQRFRLSLCPCVHVHPLTILANSSPSSSQATPPGL